jgi:hypothetical protein
MNLMETNLQPQADLAKVQNLLQEREPKVINLGLEIFAETLRQQGAAVIHVDWQPPAGGNSELTNMLADLSDLD